jgi:Ca2+-binding RTX toxin-like protein
VSPGVIATSTVAADSTTTFTDLQTSARYAAGETVTGPFVYYSTFNTSTAAATGGGARVLAWDAGTETYDHPEWWPDTDERREFIGPTNPATVDGITLALYDVWTVTA